MVDSSERSWDEIWDAGAQESPHHGADTLLLAVLEGVEPGRAHSQEVSPTSRRESQVTQTYTLSLRSVIGNAFAYKIKGTCVLG